MSPTPNTPGHNSRAIGLNSRACHHTHQLHSPSPHATSISCIIEHFINYLEPVFIPIIKAAEIERYDLYECDYSLQSIYFR